MILSYYVSFTTETNDPFRWKIPLPVDYGKSFARKVQPFLAAKIWSDMTDYRSHNLGLQFFDQRLQVQFDIVVEAVAENQTRLVDTPVIDFVQLYCSYVAQLARESPTE